MNTKLKLMYQREYDTLSLAMIEWSRAAKQWPAHLELKRNQLLRAMWVREVYVSLGDL